MFVSSASALPSPDEIYASSLQMIDQGYAMWHPEPHETGEPEIGDVGFISKGSFVKLFSIYDEEGTPFWRKPFKNNHPFDRFMVQIDKRDALDPGEYRSHGVEGKGVEAGADISAGTGISGGLSASYKCHATYGAVLTLRSRAYSQALFPNDHLKRYIKTHHNTWYAYVKHDLGRPIKQPELVVVSGWVKTSADWVAAAFSNMDVSSHAAAKAEAAGVAGAHLAMSSESSVAGPVLHRQGSGLGLPQGDRAIDQCVFLRRYKLRKRFLLPRKIVAAAGYHRLPEGRGGDGASPAVGLTAEDEEQDVGYMWHWAGQGGIPDPLDVLLDYMLEVSGAEIVLASDDDVRVITSGRPIVDFASYLRWLQPPVELEDNLGLLRIEDLVRHQTGLSVARRRISYVDWAKWPSASQDSSGRTGDLEIFTPRMGDTPVKIKSLLLAPIDPDRRCTHFAHSPDGTLLAAAFDDHGEFVWRVSDGTLLQQHRRGIPSVRCMAFSPQGTEVVFGYSSGDATVWVVASGEERLRLLAGSKIYAVAYSPDGRHIATGDESGHAKVWDNRTGELQHTFSPIKEDAMVYSLAFLPREAPWDLFVHRDTGISIYDLQSGARHDLGAPKEEKIQAVALSQRWDRVALAIGNRTEVWSTEDRKLVLRLKSEKAFATLGFSPDGKEVYAGTRRGKAIYIFDVSTGAPLREYKLQSDYGYTCAYSPNGEFMAISDYDRVLLYDRRSSCHPDYSARFTPVSGSLVEEMKFLPDNRTLVVQAYEAPLHLIDVYAALQL